MVVIPADPQKPVEKIEKEPTLELFREVVDGYIEMVRLPASGHDKTRCVVMFVNEDGWVLDPPKPVNLRATVVANAFGYPSAMAGDVLLVDWDRQRDSYHDLPADVVDALLAMKEIKL